MFLNFVEKEGGGQVKGYGLMSRILRHLVIDLQQAQYEGKKCMRGSEFMDDI